MNHLIREIAIILAFSTALLAVAIPASASEASRTEGIPLYFQDDYPDVPYGEGTVATSGCGITCLAMVASYLTGTEYLPDDLAKRFGSYKANNLDRMLHASDRLNIPSYESLYEWEEVPEALADGKVVIMMLGEESVFTSSQHFVVLTGITGEGKFTVLDPNKENYKREDLNDGYKNGFSDDVLRAGFNGAWAYDKGQETDVISGNPNAEADLTVSNERLNAVIESFDTVPLYFQSDYRHVRYGTGTIATSGCNITALAMVASYMTEHQYMPDEIADFVSDFIGNNIQCFEYGADLLKLSWCKAENFHYAMDALHDGKIVVALMNGKSLFTNGQHFIILTGINEEGKITVHDPNESNYHVWNLKNAFVNGFKEGDILLGYDGAWIFDKSSMPSTPFIYEKEEVFVDPRYPDIELTNEDMDLLARMIWVEARGESFEGQQAIAEIVLNRIKSANFPNTVKSVIYSPHQFNSTAFLDDAEPTHTQYEAIEKALYGPYILDEDVVFFSRTAINDNIWGKIGGHTFCRELNAE